MPLPQWVKYIHSLTLLVYFSFKTITCWFQYFVWKLSINMLALSLGYHLIIFLFTYRNVSFPVFKGSRTSDKIYKLSVIFWAINTGNMNTWNCKNVSLHLCLEMFLLHLSFRSHIFASLSTCRTASRMFHTRSCNSSCVHRNFKLPMPPSSHDSVWNWIR